MEKIVIITGPTCVGKTNLAVKLAESFNGEIVNADAFQVYQKMNIGTAKPTPSEQGNIKHHLFDFLDSKEEFSVADYQAIARMTINKIIDNKKLPFLVGGSGLYLNAVVKEYHFNEAKRDENKFNDFSNQDLYEMLKKLDPNASEKIHLNNRKRLIRALELAERPDLKDSRAQGSDNHYNALCIFLNADREKLYARINERVLKMFENGLVDEVKNIGINNFSKTAKAAIGYKEVIAYLNNELSLSDAINQVMQKTRNYAKRQITWFRHQIKSSMIMVDYDHFENTINEAYQLVENFLARS